MMAKGFGKPVLNPKLALEAKILSKSVLKHFQHLQDPRVGRRKDHKASVSVPTARRSPLPVNLQYIYGI